MEPMEPLLDPPLIILYTLSLLKSSYHSEY